MSRRNAHLVPTTRRDPYAPIKQLVLDSVDSPHTKRAYARALDDFLAWHMDQGHPPLNKATVQRYRQTLLDAGYRPASVNQRLSAIRKLAREAADNGLLDPLLSQGIDRVPGAKQAGRRLGNWLTLEEAQRLIDAPDTSTLKGLRDRAILAVALGAGLRRSEIVGLTWDQLQRREGRWALVDIEGKHGRIRSIAIPPWTKRALDAWQAAAGITSGAIFRPLHKSGALIEGWDRLHPQTVHDLLTHYADRLGWTLAPHDLRRTFAWLAYRAGTPIEQIQRALGHASVATTERYLGDIQDFQHAPADGIALTV